MKLALVFAVLFLGPIWAETLQGPPIGRAGSVALASNQIEPLAVAVDAENVYWVADFGRTIKKVSKSGGGPTTLVTEKTIGQIVVDDSSVFFTVLGGIRRVSKSGGSVTTLVQADLIGYQRLPMAVDDTNLYYYEEIGVPPGAPYKNPLLRKVTKNGGSPVTVDSRTSMPVGLATDGKNVYWTDMVNGTVKRKSLSGGPATILGRCIHPMDVVVDASAVYCKRASGEIVRFSKGEGTAVLLSAVQNDHSVHKLVLDQTNLYVMSSYKGMYGIYRISKRPGQPQLMVALQFPSRDFAVDEKSIYWTDAREGKVMRLDSR